MGALTAKMHRMRHVKARCCGGEVNGILPLSKALGIDLNFFTVHSDYYSLLRVTETDKGLL